MQAARWVSSAFVIFTCFAKLAFSQVLAEPCDSNDLSCSLFCKYLFKIGTRTVLQERFVDTSLVQAHFNFQKPRIYLVQFLADFFSIRKVGIKRKRSSLY